MIVNKERVNQLIRDVFFNPQHEIHVNIFNPPVVLRTWRVLNQVPMNGEVRPHPP